MKVDVKREPRSRAVLEVEIPPESVSEGVEAALRKLNRKVEIPGFRRGKAPRTMLERFVGKETVLEEAVKELVPDAYARAVDQVGVTPITRPEIKVDEVKEGEPLRFVATVDLMPEVKIADYQSIRIPHVEPQVGDPDIDAAVEDLRSRHGHLVSAQADAARGDFVLVKVADLSGPLERFSKGKEYLIEIGGGSFLPEVTDEFARTAAGAGSVTVLREQLREKLSREAAEAAQGDYEQKVLDALLERATIDLPDSMIDHEVEHMVGDLADTLQKRGLTLQRYYEATQKDEPKLREEFRPAAERRIRAQLAIEEVARAEQLSPAQEEIDREVENVARRLQQDPARVREWLTETGRYDSLTGTLRRQKALAHLVTLARGERS